MTEDSKTEYDSDVILKTSGRTQLLWWGEETPAGCAPKPYNSHEVFSVYAQATGCTFEEAMRIAAEALIAQWNNENAEQLLAHAHS